MQNSARKRVTPIGYLVLLAFPCASSFAVVYARASLIQMMSVFGAVLVIAFFITWLRNSRIRISRDLPRLASVGEDLVYTVHYENLRSGKLANFLLEELPPDPSPSKELFLGSTEPGEEQRNAFDRTFIAYRWMWLVKQRIFFDSKATVCDSVRKGESKHCLMQITPKRRGVIKLSNMRALLPDPFGVFQRIQQVEQSTDHLIVLPKRYRVGDLHLSGSSRNQIGGEALSSISGHAGEFVGLREYRPGDPLRHIHWPSWGKSGKPIVKEYEDVFFPRYGLFLDTVVSAEKANLFEEGVSMAASFACAVDTRECLLDLIFMQQGAKVLTVGRGVAKVENMLETLAGVEIDLKPHWRELEKMILQHTENLTACIAIFCDWSEDRLKMVQKWEAAGLSLLLFYVCDDEKLAREQLKGMAKRFKIAPVDKIQQVLYSL
ncbi:hypothetical protein Rhal01_00363 [Rubritalea halochordaticola]|uniref:DUF58 domain-containing protein n=1 Tax=Rubritalea halochordaticola TaxID=714537 RepID=A0ABP9UUX1_9BACT